MHLMTSYPIGPNCGHRHERGVSLIELMVSVAIGLILVAGALTLFTTNVVGSRKLTVEARVNQDLRAAADLIARDVRRAGYWANAISGTITTGTGSTTTANDYSTITGTYDATSSVIYYRFARDSDDAAGNNEKFGFRVTNGAIEMKTDDTPTWQAITDVNVVTVTKLYIHDEPTDIAVGDMCTSGCNTTPPTPKAAPTTACPNPPTLTMHRFDILIEGNAKSDSTLKRTLRESVRVRNDQFSGSCP